MDSRSTEDYVDARNIGRAVVTVISEGILPWPPDYQAPEVEWRAEVPEADENGVVPLGALIVHIQTPEASIIVDPGFDDPDSDWQQRYAKQSPGLTRTAGMAAALASIGVSPEEVAYVLITHTHSDHYCGVTQDRDGETTLRFPNARHFVGRGDWEGALDREQADSDLSQRIGLVEQAGLLVMVDEETEVAPGVAIIPAPGESPGHCIVRLRSEGETFYYVGDLYHHACEVAHPDWSPSNRDQAANIRSRESLAEEAVPADATIVFTHESFPGWGKIERSALGADHRWAPNRA